MSRHNNPALSWLSGLLLNRARIGLLITIPALTVSGCIGCEEGSEVSLSALLSESATGSASASNITGTSTGTALGTSTSSSQLTTGNTLTGSGLASTGTLRQTTQQGALGGCVGEGGVGTDLSIPRALQIFDVTLVGTVGSEDFSTSGVLILRPTVEAATGNFDNEFNMRDVGLFSGDPTTPPQEAGEIWFATNTAIHRQPDAGIGIGDAPSDLLAADVAFVEADSQTNVLTITIDPEFAAVRQAQNFNAISDPNVNVAPLEIVGGTMTLEFAGEGETLTGNVNFAGGGAGQIEITEYTASITGTRRIQ
jgi:hypothetical protein